MYGHCVLCYKNGHVFLAEINIKIILARKLFINRKYRTL